MEAALGIVLLVGLVVAFFAGAWEKYWLSTIALTIAFCVSGLTFSAIGAFVVANTALVVAGALSFVVVGILWSFFKWFRFCRAKANLGKEEIAQRFRNAERYQNPHDACEVDSQEKRLNFMLRFKPNVRYELDRIAGWIAFWPLSIFWTIVTELLRDVFVDVAKFFKKQYQTITDRAFQVT